MGIEKMLLIFSGVCWTMVYIDSIRIGLKDKTYAMPFWALVLNFAWEVLHTILGFEELGFMVQVIINGIWVLFDCGILYTYFKFGLKEFPKSISSKWFYPFSIAGLVISFIVQFCFIQEFGLFLGASYAAFLQNLLMSILFISMLIKRENSQGQTLLIAISKCIGTLAPTILFGYIGLKVIGGANQFVLTIGIVIFMVDLTYILMLLNTKRKEKNGDEKLIII